LQSGNVIVETSRKLDDVARDMQRRIMDRFGFEVGVVARSARQLRRVVSSDPLAKVVTDPSRYLVLFSSKPLRKSDVSLDADSLSPEMFFVATREVYAWCPKGVQRSPLMKQLSILERSHAVVTARNWRTVTKLVEMLA
jgi:uncharacterized protein (DUF1697 family)